jgi:hypothetical protein
MDALSFFSFLIFAKFAADLPAVVDLLILKSASNDVSFSWTNSTSLKSFSEDFDSSPSVVLVSPDLFSVDY